MSSSGLGCSVLFRVHCFKDKELDASKKYRVPTINIGVSLSLYWNMYEWIERAVV